MKAEDVRPAERLLNRLGCLNETLAIMRAGGRGGVNVSTRSGARWCGSNGIEVDQDRLAEFLQIEITECEKQLEVLGIELSVGDPVAAALRAKEWLR